jgi:hypothetical protein
LKRSVALRWPEWLLETSQFPVLVVPKGQTERLAYISEFVEAAKSSGLVQRAIGRAGPARLPRGSAGQCRRRSGGRRMTCAEVGASGSNLSMREPNQLVMPIYFSRMAIGLRSTMIPHIRQATIEPPIQGTR